MQLTNAPIKERNTMKNILCSKGEQIIERRNIYSKP